MNIFHTEYRETFGRTIEAVDNHETRQTSRANLHTHEVRMAGMYSLSPVLSCESQIYRYPENCAMNN